MINTVIVLQDGTEIISGANEHSAILNAEITRMCNSDTDLTIGSVCAAVAEIKILSPGVIPVVSAGDSFSVYRDYDGIRKKIGVFVAETPVQASANTYCITAYDNVGKLDKDLTDWLSLLSAWPYRLDAFAELVAAQCGCTLIIPDGLPNADYQIPRFLADDITGRKLLSWCAQIAARYIVADKDGLLRFGWYTDTGNAVTAGGEQYIYQGGIRYEDYVVAPIDKVQIQLTSDDIGVSFPDVEGSNVYKITGNYLLTAVTSGQLSGVAMNIFNELHGVHYTPGSVSTPDSGGFDVGDIIKVTDAKGREIKLYAMSVAYSGQKVCIECTGNRSRDSASAKNNESFGVLNSKIFEVQKDIAGMKLKASDTSTRLENQIEITKTRVTEIAQDAANVSIRVAKIETDGVDKVKTSIGYTLSDDGLHIQKSGEEIDNSIDNTGMYVKRGDEVMLQANKDGVIATDVTVRNYLIIGSHARFEDYSGGTNGNRTACFYIGGGN